MKISLGTAQFGLNYGVANASGRIPKKEASNILQVARKYGIDTLDTAIAYGESEKTLGEIGVESWKLVTKLPFVPNDCPDISIWIRQQVLDSMRRLGVKKLYGLLLHRPEQLLGGTGLEIYKSLISMRDEGLIHKIGISIYTISELDQIFDKFLFEIVQGPLNILDRSLIDSGWGAKLSNLGIEIHARSIFLQGLLLMPPYSRPKKFDQWHQIWQEWDGWIQSTGLSPLEACLHYVMAQNCIDKIIVGVDSISHLNQIIFTRNILLPDLPHFSSLKDRRLLNPPSWNLI